MWVWYCRPPIGAHFHPTPQPPPVPQQLGEKAHLRTLAAATTLVYPMVTYNQRAGAGAGPQAGAGPAPARGPAPAGCRRPTYTASWLMRSDVSHIGLVVDTGDGGSCRCCSSTICLTRSVLTTCLPTVCFIATAVRRSQSSHSSCFIYLDLFFVVYSLTTISIVK